MPTTRTEAQHEVKFSLRHSVPIHHDPVQHEHSLEVEVDHVGDDDVLPHLLDTDHGAVGGCQGSDAPLHDEGVHEDGSFLEQLGSMFW